MEIEITPEPTEPEREAILAALTAATEPDPAPPDPLTDEENE